MQDLKEHRHRKHNSNQKHNKIEVNLLNWTKALLSNETIKQEAFKVENDSCDVMFYAGHVQFCFILKTSSEASSPNLWKKLNFF